MLFNVKQKQSAVTIHTPAHLKLNTCVQVTSHLKCIRLVSVRSSLPRLNIGVRIELTQTKCPQDRNCLLYTSDAADE